MVTYNYKYNGKELQETGMYDYGARFYMPDIGRFGQYDPLAEKTMEPYAYVYNNPIMMIDPTGMVGEGANDDMQTGVDGDTSLAFGVRASDVQKVSGMGGMNSYNYGDSTGTKAASRKDDRSNTNSAAIHNAGVEAAGDYSPDDIIIRNSKGNIMLRLISTVNKDISLNTTVSIATPITINLSDYERAGASAVGFNVEYSGTFGGGMNGGWTFVYFLAGMDKGSAYVLSYSGGNVGFEGGASVSKFYSVYKDKDLRNFNVGGFSGKSSGYSGGGGVAGASYSWGNRENRSTLWPGQGGTTTTWLSRSSGLSKGGDLGAKIFWSNSTIRYKVF